MELSKQNREQLHCRLRGKWVAAQPEEIVRQRVISLMIDLLGYPPELMILEASLQDMPHLIHLNKRIPKRRADILCYARAIHPKHLLYPLLLIECKAVKLTPKVLNQTTGYNHFVEACFIAVANGDEIRTGWFDKDVKSYKFVNSLPYYSDLLNAVKGKSHH